MFVEENRYYTGDYWKVVTFHWNSEQLLLLAFNDSKFTYTCNLSSHAAESRYRSDECQS